MIQQGMHISCQSAEGIKRSMLFTDVDELWKLTNACSGTQRQAPGFTEHTRKFTLDFLPQFFVSKNTPGRAEFRRYQIKVLLLTTNKIMFTANQQLWQRIELWIKQHYVQLTREPSSTHQLHKYYKKMLPPSCASPFCCH